MDIADDNPHPLRPHICPRCEYSLQAHPPKGICPECGYEYDDETVFLYGDALGEKSWFWNAPPISSAKLAIAGMLLPIAAAILMAAVAPLCGFLPLILVVYLMLAFIARGSRRILAGDLPTVQVKLGLGGFRQGNRQFGPMPFARNLKRRIPWHRARSIRLELLPGDQIRLLITPANWSFTPYQEYVHAILHCTPAQAAELQNRVEQWWGRPLALTA
jgi:hypothetical protein